LEVAKWLQSFVASTAIILRVGFFAGRHAVLKISLKIGTDQVSRMDDGADWRILK
jgi:hypothetical protein